ncbi:sensor histidine kinase [Cryobacterium zongtaii]|uniref:Oxygen sensor histidine kinase NreB n=1 Tax=Cryobacterium zongtaii TaxID=1259217 RepID=A0A2S3Z522_9MICO|nr:sensor histidine kinase [Cryobacterium zongtaii]POH58719.1 sensor histidine kinase [Cryobacterium zongtaii]
MSTRRWWDVAVAGALAVLAVMAIEGSGGGAPARIGALLSLAAVGVAYLGWGRLAIARATDRPEVPPSVADTGFRVVVIVSCGVATAFDPSMATLQTLVFPFLWVLARTYRGAVLLNITLATVTGLGLWISGGRTADAAVQAAAIEGISLAFALAMGTWISRIVEAGAYQRRLVEELTLAQDELAAAQRDAGSAAERERLAREIHDTIAQSLTSLVMLTQRTRSELAAVPGDTAAVADGLDLIESTGRDALTEARALVASMSPVRAADGDLAHTVTRLAERFERETGIQVTVDLTGLEPAGTAGAAGLDRALEVVLLRCGQEGLANVRKHSGAGAARVTIARTPHEVALTVTDNGRGLGAYRPESEHGFGLTGMRDRVGLVGGRLEVTDAANGSGTVLRVTLPLLATAPSTGGRG